jgi:hypothetical protein
MWHAWERRGMCTRLLWENQKERYHMGDQGADGIRMDLREIGWGSVDWIQLAQDRDRWRTLVNTVMNLRVLVPRRCLVFFNSFSTINFKYHHPF